MSAPEYQLRIAGGVLELGETPVLMGVVNATPDSFSDGGLHRRFSDRLAHARGLVAAGARVIDIGGESGVTNRPAVAAEAEIERVVPLIEALSAEPGVIVSVDTYKPAVAAAAITAGARIVNDVTGLRHPELADVCAELGAGLILTHTRAAPKEKLLDPAFDATIVEDVRGLLAERLELALSRGVAREQIMLDPGPDLGKTPAQTVAVLRALADLHALGRPLLLAVSRKDFVGAITRRPPRERLAGTLAAIGFGVQAGAHMLRVHDVQAVADFLAVRAVLEGERELAGETRLPEALRREPVPAPEAEARLAPPRPLG